MGNEGRGIVVCMKARRERGLEKQYKTKQKLQINSHTNNNNNNST